MQCHTLALSLASLAAVTAPFLASPRPATPTLPSPAAAAGGQSVCEETAIYARQAKRDEAYGDYFRELGICANITDPIEQAECINDAFDELQDELDEIDEQFDARTRLCGRLGGGAFDPDIDPAEFTDVITNPLLPFSVGSVWTYEAQTAEGLETVRIEVMNETRTIDGVSCRVVRDVAELEGEEIEVTDDYYAQDLDGNVWYFGEIARNFEDGYLVDLDGSWITGEDGARPGIVMFDAPLLGTTYRQEFLLLEAEDIATVLSLSGTATVPFGTFAGCLETADYTPIEPDAFEIKTYAPGVGLVLELDPASGERLELITYTP